MNSDSRTGHNSTEYSTTSSEVRSCIYQEASGQTFQCFRSSFSSLGRRVGRRFSPDLLQPG